MILLCPVLRTSPSFLCRVPARLPTHALRAHHTTFHPPPSHADSAWRVWNILRGRAVLTVWTMAWRRRFTLSRRAGAYHHLPTAHYPLGGTVRGVAWTLLPFWTLPPARCAYFCLTCLVQDYPRAYRLRNPINAGSFLDAARLKPQPQATIPLQYPFLMRATCRCQFGPHTLPVAVAALPTTLHADLPHTPPCQHTGLPTRYCTRRRSAHTTILHCATCGWDTDLPAPYALGTCHGLDGSHGRTDIAGIRHIQVKFVVTHPPPRPPPPPPPLPLPQRTA